jgi:multidrug resistance efflux pump
MIETELAPAATPVEDSVDTPSEAVPQPNSPVETGLRRTTKIALIVVVALSLLEISAFAGTYLLYTRHYVSTDNAQVDGDQILINAPVTGNVTDWSVGTGATVRDNQVVGRIQAVGGGAQTKRAVRAPGAGTIALSAVVEGQYVTEGTTLAAAYDPSAMYITARVADTDIGGVRLGQPVDIAVDAYPGAHVSGVVIGIQAAAAGKFTIFPSLDADPTNPQKVDQYIPVKISISNYDGAHLLPGMSVAVDIRR